jgi:hypothetical protein
MVDSVFIASLVLVAGAAVFAHQNRLGSPRDASASPNILAKANKQATRSTGATGPKEARFPEAGPATLKLRHIIEGLENTVKTWQSQKSWLLRYRHTRDVINVDMRPGFYESSAELDFSPHEITNARKGKWLFRHVVIDDGSNADKDGTPIHLRCLWKDNQLFLNQVKIRDEDLPKGIHALGTYWWYPNNLWIPIWQDALPRPRGLGIADPESDLLTRKLQKKNATFTVRNKLEKINGVPCHVIERKGNEVYWIDAAHGFAVRRCNIHLPSGALKSEWIACGLREMSKGVWLPEKQVLVNYFSDGSGKIWNIVSNSLLEARFNDIPDEFFAIPKRQQPNPAE